MTVAELIRTLERIQDKSLEVVADIGFDSCNRPTAQLITKITKTKICYKTIKNNKWCGCARKCVKIY